MISRVPSVQSIKAIGWLDKVGDPDEIARKVRKVLRDAVRAPENQALDGTIKRNPAWDALTTVDQILRTHGVEALSRGPDSCARHYYCNAGDPYVATILFSCVSGSFRVACWGDVVEAEERRGIKYQ